MLTGDVASLGVNSLQERLDAIGYAVQIGLRDPATTKWVMDAVAYTPHSNLPGAAEQQVVAVFEALKRSGKYRYHPRGTDRIQSLLATVKMRAWDCDQAVVFLVTALHILGFQTACIIMSADEKVISHIWTQVGMPRNQPNHWVDLDPTTGPGGTPQSAVVGYAPPHRQRAWWKRYVFQFS